jgi:type I restriction enzyme S subunit
VRKKQKKAIPQPNWRWAKLKDLVVFQRGFDITKNEQKDGSVPVISSSGIRSFHSEVKVCGPGVIIGRKGTLGTVHFSESDYWPHDTTLWSKDFKGNNSRYVYYFIQTLGLERYNVGNANPTLNRNHIHGLEIRIPLIHIQRRIADILSVYDDLIENNRRRIQLLEKSARLLYKEWFVRLRFPGHERVKIKDGVPEGWLKLSAFEAMDVLSGGTPKTGNMGYWNGNIPFFTPKDATSHVYVVKTEKMLTEQGLKSCNSKLYPKDTIFITARGTVGNINLAQADMAMNQSCYALRSKPPLNQHFLYFALVEGVEHFRSRAVGAVFDAIIRDTFKLIPFVVPNRELINTFTGFAAPIIQEVENLLIQSERLRQARDLLLPRLMNGGIEV